MKPYDILLLTESRYENPVNPNWYAEQILAEDRILGEALGRRGLKTRRVDWARKDFDWSDAHFAMFRTTWDYFNRFAEFSEWLERASRQTQLVNDPELIRWNMDKHYLGDLEQRGVRIVPTRFVEAGERVTLQDLHRETGWAETVLKPAVSGAGRHTYRLNADNLAAHEPIFQQLLAAEAMLLQPFQKSIVEVGEKTLMLMDGQFTHAVLKKAKAGEFRVQDDFGGTVESYAPTRAEIEFAEAVFAVCDPAPLYGRVDLVADNHGKPAVVELELIEPELWFRFHPPAAEVLADSFLNLF
jgi:glutathione synthase/RimK-type ligase-like ATP-grasp enzyme